MFIYHAIPALLLLARVLAGNTKRNRTAFYLFCGVLILWVGFRFQVGCDWYSYSQYGAPTRYLSWADALSQRDPLFHLMAKLLSSLGISFYPGINLFTATVFFVGTALLSTLARDKLLFLFYMYPVAIVVTAMSGLRQAIAMGILMIAFQQLVSRRFVNFALLVLLAAGFHGSAFLLIILWPLFNDMRLSRKLLLIALSSIPAGFAFASSNTVDLALERYTSTDLEAFGAIFRLALLAIGSVVFFALIRDRWRMMYPSAYPLVQFTMTASLVLLALALIPLPGVSSVIFDRLGLYLVPVAALMQAVAPDIAKPKDARLLAIGFCVLYIVFFMMWTILSRKFAGCYNPYSSYLLGAGL